ncbi:hypothetical protein L1987_10838 [Smallanthus sonchifolius]|uniref:Uncharacterized protein n=1 Tax=Smallanthus sonchifolius TaxID=185202 RepID=A0ACB9JBH2_9ASTR|nr:hypothetical protein L1987_10838 [Smallanthus sonchifolius]
MRGDGGLVGLFYKRECGMSHCSANGSARVKMGKTEVIASVKAQASIRPKEIKLINLNPSCPYQLVFHLADGCNTEAFYSLH